jgi:glycosyltransferase involved in cell wall biosynthesis
MASVRLRIIEPNLVGASGHYAEFVRAVASRARGTFGEIEVLCDRGAPAGTFAAERNVRTTPTFGGTGRRTEEWQAIRDCCAGDDPFLLLTARTPDVAMAEMAARLGRRRLGHARFYFHWREASLAQRLATRAFACARMDALAIAPTPATAEFLRAQGWRHVREIPYPALAPKAPFAPQPLRHLLVAGAARMNKGIDRVASFARTLAERGDGVELLVQSTGKRREGPHRRKEAAALAQLAASGLPGLRMDERAPDRAEYADRFRGALVLTPYDPRKFADNVSGIALDALLHGAPVVATAGSWQARVIERFGAGTIMAAWDAASLDAAVAEARARWDEVSAGAQRAARTLAAEHDPAHLVRALAGG